MRNRDFGPAFGLLSLLVAFASACLLGYLVLQHLGAVSVARKPVAAPAPPSFDCAAPAVRGDRVIITITHEGERLAARCTLVTDPLQPQRALK
jgi:hypothetical protein